MLTESLLKLSGDLIRRHALDVPTLKRIDQHAVLKESDRRRRWGNLRHARARVLGCLHIDSRKNCRQVIRDDRGLQRLGDSGSGASGRTAADRIHDNQRRPGPGKNRIHILGGLQWTDTALRQLLPHRPHGFRIIQRLHTNSLLFRPCTLSGARAITASNPLPSQESIKYHHSVRDRLLHIGELRDSAAQQGSSGLEMKSHRRPSTHPGVLKSRGRSNAVHQENGHTEPYCRIKEARAICA